MNTAKFWLVLLIVSIGSSLFGYGVSHQRWIQIPPQSSSELRQLPIDELVQKLENGTSQEKINAATILGLERHYQLNEKHVPVLVKALKSDYGALGFQCAYALVKMGKKAQSAAPALEKLEQTYQGKFAHNIVKEALGTVVSGISAEDAELVSGKIFQVTVRQDVYEDGRHIKRSLQFSRGFLRKSVFSHEFDRKHPAWIEISRLKEYDWVCLDVTDDAQVNLIVLSSSK